MALVKLEALPLDRTTCQPRLSDIAMEIYGDQTS